MRRAGPLAAMLMVISVAACGGSGSAAGPVYLDGATGRPAMISSLERSFCSGHIPQIEDAAPYWVGLCRDRSNFEESVFFMVFNSKPEMLFYFDHFESCIADAHYARGPTWFAMATASGDAESLVHAGATSLSCP